MADDGAWLRQLRGCVVRAGSDTGFHHLDVTEVLVKCGCFKSCNAGCVRDDEDRGLHCEVVVRIAEGGTIVYEVLGSESAPPQHGNGPKCAPGIEEMRTMGSRIRQGIRYLRNALPIWLPTKPLYAG